MHDDLRRLVAWGPVRTGGPDVGACPDGVEEVPFADGAEVRARAAVDTLRLWLALVNDLAKLKEREPMAIRVMPS